MSSRKYIALKVVKGSLEYDQFSQLCILHVHMYIIYFVELVAAAFLFTICLPQWNLSITGL